MEKREAALRETEDHGPCQGTPTACRFFCVRVHTSPCNSCCQWVAPQVELDPRRAPGPTPPTPLLRRGMVGRGARAGWHHRARAPEAGVRRSGTCAGGGGAPRRSRILYRGPVRRAMAGERAGVARGSATQNEPRRRPWREPQRAVRGPARHAAGGFCGRHVERRSGLGPATLHLRCAGVSGPMVQWIQRRGVEPRRGPPERLNRNS